MRNYFLKIPPFFLFLFILGLGISTQAQEKRIGLAFYEVVSGENVDYLKKAVRESLSAGLKEKGGITLVEIEVGEEELKRKGIAKVLKTERLDALVTGSVVKVGAPVQINSRIYGPAAPEEPAVVSLTVENLDRLLPTLKGHAQAIFDQVQRIAVVQVAPLAPPPAAPLPPPEPKKVEAKKEVEKVPEPTPKLSKATPVPEEVAPPPASKKSKQPKTVAAPPTQTIIVSNPDYQWLSERLPFEGRGLAYDDLDGDGTKEVVVIDLHNVFVYRFSQNQLGLLAHFEGKPEDNFVRVYTLDLNQDGRSEIVVSNIRSGQAASLGLRFDNGEIQPIFKNSPWLVKVLPWEGRPTLVGEPYYGTEVDYHKIRKLVLSGDKLKEDGELKLPSGVGIYGLTDFKALAQDPQGIMYLTSSGSLKIYDREEEKYKKKWSSSEKYGGSSNWIHQKVRNYFNEVEESKTYINIDPIAWLDREGRSEVVVAKNDNFLKNVIGTMPIVKNCFFTKLKWEELGLREIWTTRKIDGYIADYRRVQLPWEASPKLLSLIWIREPGFGGAMGKFKSALAVYDLN